MVIHFRNLDGIDYPGCWQCCRAVYFAHEYVSRAGRKMGLAMELIMTPLVERLMEGKQIA